ncbi:MULTISPECIES: NAD(+) diphosphatase [unclassified Arsukibacterium]|uniref:NAD(+) diphosphatase n=1 Tax=unclassified Arsukibacterium TaxID=2635278 RepID=UPI000C61C0DF|nr:MULTISPECIES: NAD(+) diphosphatase [unclassified Arsukibacterium]MAA94266.1 NAD(+) diphosphatase [Rheinheimera sp.]MBM34646.1 NAD(+) diphosphatase [Rheinheimera sp.]HAW94051.1 NAD(+) diphosphatase [Candidatus Azambacteria bacterium]|tara:strand:+ start:15232 stop:16035 length:804 start_codon:yes stop_codon:yes gene_type:complete
MIKHSITLPNEKSGCWFIVNKGRLFLTADGQVPQGTLASLTTAAKPEQICWLGEYQQQPCYLLVDHDQVVDDSTWHSPRSLLAQSEVLFEMAARALQVALFLQTHRFCGQCGSAMHLINWELAALCNKCGHRCYPRIAPCVLVGITRPGQILLARSTRHKPGFYSILAGFVESAETLEQAAVREVKEEVGVDIANLSYVGSQPWPFPHSLMTGFTAEYQQGKIVCQPNEIAEAAWFDLAKLPEIPPEETLSGKIIRQLQQQHLANCR